MAVDEEVTPSRVLTLEHNYANLGKEVRALGTQITEERADNKEFRELILKKLNEKSDFNLMNTMKTALTTIAIVAAVTASIDYRISASVATIAKDGEYRDKAILAISNRADSALAKASKHEIELSNMQKEVDGISNFVDHFQYVEKYPIQINTMQSDIAVLKQKYK